jgi:hypothetical protein
VESQLAILKRMRAVAMVRLDGLVEDLDRHIADRSAALAPPLRYPVFASDGSISGSKIVKPVVVASGGSPAARLVARQKEVTAISAFELRIRFCDEFPEGAQFIKTADLLFEAATGRAGKCRPACVRFLQALRGQVPIDKSAWKGRMAERR